MIEKPLSSCLYLCGYVFLVLDPSTSVRYSIQHRQRTANASKRETHSMSLGARLFELLSHRSPRGVWIPGMYEYGVGPR